MADKKPIYAEFDSNGNVSSLNEFNEAAGDTISPAILNQSISSLDDVSSNLVPQVGDVLVWGGTEWTASADGGSGGGGASYLSALLDASNVETACEGASLMFVGDYWQPSGPAQVTATEPSCGYVGQLWYDISQQSLDLLQSLSGVEVSANYELGTGERIIYADASAGDITISGVTASSFPNRLIDIHKTDSTLNKVYVSGIGSTINGNTSVKLSTQNDSITIHSFNNNWYIL
jgi:hypothetical protein